MRYIKSYAVEADIDVYLDDDDSYILKFDDYSIVDYNKEDGYTIRLVNDENLEFEEPNGCEQD